MTSPQLDDSGCPASKAPACDASGSVNSCRTLCETANVLLEVCRRDLRVHQHIEGVDRMEMAIVCRTVFMDQQGKGAGMRECDHANMPGAGMIVDALRMAHAEGRKSAGVRLSVSIVASDHEKVAARI